MSDGQRNELISKTLDKLIKSLAGADATTAERRKYEQQVLHKIRKHRNLSTNSHEVRRSIDNLADRFCYENMAAEADALGELSQLITDSTLWKGHYEVDIQYSVIDFLFCMIYAPIQNVRQNRDKMSQRLLAIKDAVKTAIRNEAQPHSVHKAVQNIDWVALLSEDFIQKSSPSSDDNDSLSDWSTEAEDEDSPLPVINTELKTSLHKKNTARVCAEARNYSSSTTSFVPDSAGMAKMVKFFKISKPKWCTLPVLKPLLPLRPFNLHVSCDFIPNELPLKIHSLWWKQYLNINVQLTNDNPRSNFAIAFVQHQNKSLRSMLKHVVPNTMTEYSLLREIIFMFFMPTSCFFFELNLQQQRITVRENVTICSVSVGTLRDVLKVEILPAMNAMMQLRHIIKKHALPEDDPTVGTLEYFALAVRDLIQPINKRLVDFEQQLIEHATSDMKPDQELRTTLIGFVRHMKEQFKLLLLLQSLASKVIIEAPAYLSSAYLLSRLSSLIIFNSPQQKIVMALLLAALRRYCVIIDNWWQRAELNDSSDEYIMEICKGNLEGPILRERLPLEVEYNNQEVKDVLSNCPLYKLLVEHALKACQTQKLLDSANMLPELLNASRQLQPLHVDLSKQLFKDLMCCAASETKKNTESSDLQLQLPQSNKSMVNYEILSILTYRLRRMQIMEQAKVEPAPVLNTLNHLKSCLTVQLPYVLPNVMGKVLDQRCEVANVFVMQWYREQLKLGEHVRFLCDILLLEADFRIYPFYSNLFDQIESGREWAHFAHLTWELFDVLDRHYPGLASKLHVQPASLVSSRSNKVYEALDAIELVYEMTPPLQRIITEKHMAQYNAIWRFLLKVKWAAWKLENMQFVRRTSKDVFAPLDLLGLTVRRLEILRFWLMYIINNLHTHLCTYVMQAMGSQFVEQLKSCTSLQELFELHNDYLKQLFMHCLLGDLFADFRTALEQLFHLVVVLDMEWTSCYSYLNKSSALSLDVSFNSSYFADSSIPDVNNRSEEDAAKALEYLALNHVDEIERTYVRCHHMLANILTSLVYDHECKFLDSLEVAINSSVPC